MLRHSLTVVKRAVPACLPSTTNQTLPSPRTPCIAGRKRALSTSRTVTRELSNKAKLRQLLRAEAGGNYEDMLLEYAKKVDPHATQANSTPKQAETAPPRDVWSHSPLVEEFTRSVADIDDGMCAASHALQTLNPKPPYP